MMARTLQPAKDTLIDGSERQFGRKPPTVCGPARLKITLQGPGHTTQAFGPLQPGLKLVITNRPPPQLGRQTSTISSPRLKVHRLRTQQRRAVNSAAATRSAAHVHLTRHIIAPDGAVITGLPLDQAGAFTVFTAGRRAALDGGQSTTLQHHDRQATCGTRAGHDTAAGATADDQHIRLFCEHSVRT
jgi:hypothetical protein